MVSAGGKKSPRPRYINYTYHASDSSSYPALVDPRIVDSKNGLLLKGQGSEVRDVST